MPLWAKVDVDMPTDEKLIGQPVATRHLWTCLICLAKKQDHAGAINGFDCALLAGRFNIQRKSVAAALTHYQAAKMIELDPDGTIRLLHFVERQGEVSVADQRKQWRDRQARRQETITREDAGSSRVRRPADHAGITRLEVEVEEERDQKKQKPSQGGKPPAPTAAVWDSYSTAYERRYGTQPVRNATVSGQLAHFVTRVPAAEAPEIAAFYVRSNNAFYVKKGHSVGVMLPDAEKLRTEWSTGRQITGTAAAQQDQTQANLDGWAEHMSEEGRNALVGK